MTEELPFYERVQAEREDILSALKMVVRSWTYNEVESGNSDERMFPRFLEHHPEWNHDELYKTVTEEMERCMQEATNGLSRLGKTIQRS